jgi:transposase
MGQRDFETKLYYQLSLDRLVPQDHVLRRIAAAVGFSFVRPLCRPFYSHTGQPSVDPVVIFKLLLLGYLYGITSERRLAQEVRLHLGYRWFLGHDFDLPTPDHSVRSKARARFGSGVFEAFFRQSIELCRQAGLMEEGPVYVDSTLIRAVAALDSLQRREDVCQPPLSVTEYLQRLDDEAAADQQRALGREHFTWLPNEDAYLCPAGQRLRRRSNMPGTPRGRYQAPKGKLPRLSVPRALRSFRGRALAAPLVGAGAGRGGTGTAGAAAGNVTAGRAEDLRGGRLRTGEGAAWSPTDPLQRETPRSKGSSSPFHWKRFFPSADTCP